LSWSRLAAPQHGRYKPPHFPLSSPKN